MKCENKVKGRREKVDEREEGENESRKVRGWRILGHSREISCFSSCKWLQISARVQN